MRTKSPDPTHLSKVQTNKPNRNNWLQSWMSKIARAFSLDAVQRSQEEKKTWFQSWMLSASRARLSKVQGSQEKQVKRISNTLNELRTQLTQQFAKSIGRVWGSAAKPANAARGAGGDTMVEVMISTAILAVVLATAYTTSTHSLQSGLNAKYRDQALTYARAQIELVKSADNRQPSTVDAYKLDRPFCIDSSNAKVQEVSSAAKVCPLPIGETNPDNQSQYSVVDNYSPASKTFTATVTWQSANNVPNQTTLYYKPHDSFVAAPGP